MEQIFTSYMQTPIGMLEIKANEDSIIAVLFMDSNETFTDNPSALTKSGKQQLEEYFQEKRKKFDLPLHFSGTDFQNKVWHELERIDIGKTISYLQLAKNLGDAKCIRAAGTANGKNPFAIVVPCHRVVGSNNSLVGYAGGLWRKRWLLEHEQKMMNGVVSLFD